MDYCLDLHFVQLRVMSQNEVRGLLIMMLASDLHLLDDRCWSLRIQSEEGLSCGLM
jgi:hypothetical protein